MSFLAGNNLCNIDLDSRKHLLDFFTMAPLALFVFQQCLLCRYFLFGNCHPNPFAPGQELHIFNFRLRNSHPPGQKNVQMPCLRGKIGDGLPLPTGKHCKMGDGKNFAHSRKLALNFQCHKYFLSIMKLEIEIEFSQAKLLKYM